MSEKHNIVIVVDTDPSKFAKRLAAALHKLHTDPTLQHVAEPLFGQCALVTGNLADGYRADPKVQYTAIIHTIST